MKLRGLHEAIAGVENLVFPHEVAFITNDLNAIIAACMQRLGVELSQLVVTDSLYVLLLCNEIPRWVFEAGPPQGMQTYRMICIVV